MDGEENSASPDTVDRLDDMIGEAFGEGGDITVVKDGDIPNPDAPPKEDPPKEDPPKEDPPKSEDPPKEDPPKEDPPKSEDVEDIDKKFPDLDDKSTSEKARNKWAELRGELKTTRNDLKAKDDQIAELQSKLQNVEQSEVQPEVLTELQEKLAAKEKELLAYRVESTEVYQAEVKEPLANIAKQAEELGGEALVTALAEPDARKRSQALSDAVEDMNDFDRTTVYQLARDLDGVFDRQAQLRQNSEVAMQEMEKQRTLQQSQEQAQQRKEFETAAKDAWGVFESKLPFMQDDTGELRPEYKAVMEEGLKTNLVEKSPMVQAYSAYSGLMLPKVLAEVKELRRTNAALAETVAELEGATPGGSDGSSGGSIDEGGGSEEDLAFGEGLESRMASGNVSFTS